MPYQPSQPYRASTTFKTVLTGFTRSDGTRGAYVRTTSWSGPSPNADDEQLDADEKIQLACGCYWPDAEVAGTCPECVKTLPNPHVCQAHYVVCECGTPTCWQHSCPAPDGRGRLCGRCSIRAKNKAVKTAVVGALGRLARRVFFTETRPPSPSE